MSTDWRELLDRALEGAELSEADARLLAGSLADPAVRREAGQLLRFEAQLQRALGPAGGRAVELSRERLLAKAALRERAGHVRRAAAARRRHALAWLAAAAALLLAAGVWLALRAGGRYPEPRASGDYRLLDAGQQQAGAPTLPRGKRVAVGRGGARLLLGGYCDLALDPSTEAVVRGEPRREAIQLDRGRIVCRVEPGHGAFAVLTPLGSVEVRGTQFITCVEYPETQEGERDMGTWGKSAVVTVMVVTGVVACHFGDVAVLGPGMSQVFAGDEGERATMPPELKGFKGILIGTIVSEVGREFLLKIDKIATVWPQSKAERPEKAVGKTVEIVVPRNRLIEQHLRTLETLRRGDQIIVEAFDLEGFRLSVVELLRKAEGGGEREGEGEWREKREPKREGEGWEGERRDKPVRREGEGEGRVVRREGDGEGEGRVVRREGDGEGEGRAVRREGDGEGEGRVVRREEGEGERREKKTEPRAEGLRELAGYVKATPDRGRTCLGILKSVERVMGDGGPRERTVYYRIVDEERGKVLVREANGRRVVVAGTVVPGEGELGNAVIVKNFRVLGTPDEPKREKREGEGEWREKKDAPREGEGEWREKKEPKREGEGEWREKKIRRDGEGEGEGRVVRREGDGEGEGRVVRREEGERREEKVRRDGEGERREETPREGAVEGAAAWREGIAGFRGMIEGTVIAKGETSFVVRVTRVAKVWSTSTAKRPESLVGKSVNVALRKDMGADHPLAAAFAEMKAGDRVVVGAAHAEGERFTVIEVLRTMQDE